MRLPFDQLCHKILLCLGKYLQLGRPAVKKVGIQKGGVGERGAEPEEEESNGWLEGRMYGFPSSSSQDPHHNTLIIYLPGGKVGSLTIKFCLFLMLVSKGETDLFLLIVCVGGVGGGGLLFHEAVYGFSWVS